MLMKLKTSLRIDMYSWEDLLNYESHEIADILYNYNPNSSQVERSKEIYEQLQSLWKTFEALQTQRENAKPYGILHTSIYNMFVKTVLKLYTQHHPADDVQKKLNLLLNSFGINLNMQNMSLMISSCQTLVKVRSCL